MTIRKCALIYRVSSRGYITFAHRKRGYKTRRESAPARALVVTAKGREYLKELEAENVEGC